MIAIKIFAVGAVLMYFAVANYCRFKESLGYPGCTQSCVAYKHKAGQPDLVVPPKKYGGYQFDESY